MTTTALLRVKVTQDHINRGARKVCSECPIALAMCDAGLSMPEVYDDFCFYGFSRDFRRPITTDLPQVARDFVEAFDTHNAVQPFEFDLEVPV